MLRATILCLFLSLTCLTTTRADDKPILGIIPKAQHAIKIDGSLDEWDGAFVTPLNATHPDFYNRATHIYYLWDEQALYVGVRALDTNPTHISDSAHLYDGDALEFYLDTRAGADLGNPEFKPGTLHMFFTAVTGHDLKPRYSLRDLPVFHDLKLKGVEMAAAKTSTGYTLEFKLPWSNFPNFKPKAGTPIGLDVEMGSADGGHRVHRTFAYSSPESVQTPDAFGRVMLVDRADPFNVMDYRRALMPTDIQIPGNYGWLYVNACISPTISGNIGKIAADLIDADGHVKKAADTVVRTTIAGHWSMVRCDIETYTLAPGTYTLLVTAYSPDGHAIVGRRLHIILPP